MFDLRETTPFLDSMRALLPGLFEKSLLTLKKFLPEVLATC
jgi:hypothetical protein